MEFCPLLIKNDTLVNYLGAQYNDLFHKMIRVMYKQINAHGTHIKIYKRVTREKIWYVSIVKKVKIFNS